MFLAPDEDANREITVQELAIALPELLAQAESFLDETFFPDLFDSIKTGHISTNVEPAEFKRIWAEYEFVQKAKTFLDVIAANPDAVLDEDLEALPKRVAALAVLKQIDDCVVASYERTTGEELIEVERLRRFVMPPRGANPSVVKKQAISELNSELARRRHKKSNEARAWVRAEWAEHRAQYQHNKSEFARHYTRRLKLERDVDITEKQMREVWLKDTPPARKQDGLPADGE